MKKILIASIFISFSSLIYAAGNEVLSDPGDPKKQQQQQQQQPTFSLSKGYFSLFNIIPCTKPQPDTSRVTTVPVPNGPVVQPGKK
ncbi:MAG: hypothetical protein K1X54_04915 [Flavobacteriales bacterium]|nr:hypothetical protein [Flavobacteriales bacterium]